MDIFNKTVQYYLRVSVTTVVIAATKETKIEQYHLFSKYDSDRNPSDVLTWMLAEVTRAYSLGNSTVLVEQFSKL